MASLPAPSYTPCVGGGPPLNLSGGADYVVSAGVHCTNINVTTSGTVTFGPGIHIFDGAALTIQGGSTVEGSELTLYWSENGGTNDGIDVRGGALVTMSAPTSGVYAGILIYQDRNTTADVTHKLTGGSTMDFDGIIYAPSTDVEFAGGASADSSSILIIADEVEFKGGDTFLGDFDTSSILNNALLLQAKLVE